MTLKAANWTLPPVVLKLEPPFAILHGGLGPGDSLQHKKGRSAAILSELARIGRHLHGSMAQEDALNICLRGVMEFERCPLFNAGYGAKLQSDGIARLSASAMDGSLQKFASVGNIQNICHPAKLAVDLLKTQDRNLSGREATHYAFAHSYEPQSPESPARISEWKNRVAGATGTVGCVALDREGRTAAITSTGGRGFETPGRVSDSCSPAGNFANPFGAISCTGVGEEILDAAVAPTLLTRLEDGMNLSEALQKTMQRHRAKHFGLIALDSEGHASVIATRGTLSFLLITRKGIYFGMIESDWRGLSERLSENRYARIV